MKDKHFNAHIDDEMREVRHKACIGLFQKGVKADDSEDFGITAALMWGIMQCDVPGRGLVMNAVIGSPDGAMEPGVYIQIIGCCVESYARIEPMTYADIQTVVNRCAHNALETITDTHREKGSCQHSAR